MATPLFDDLVDKVRDWSNRDSTALPDPIIRDGLRYAADKAYHMLEIPPLEATITYSALTSADLVQDGGQFQNVVTLPVPADLSRFIYLRTTGRNGVLINQKTDVRTGRDMYAEVVGFDGYWYRQGGNIHVVGRFREGNVFELHYYKRLPRLDAVYAVNQNNIDAGASVVDYTAMPTDAQIADTRNMNANTATFLTSLPVDPDADPVVTMNVQGFYQSDVTAADRADDTVAVNDLTQDGLWIPMESPHWLRDENEKVLLFGALLECGSYLQDADLYGSYTERYLQEIAALNDEEGKRQASGGNIQINYNGRGLI